MNQIPLSSSPFLSSPVKQKDYAMSPEINAPEPAPAPAPDPIEAPREVSSSGPSPEPTEKKKVVVKGNTPPPPPEQIAVDPEVQMFEYDQEPSEDVTQTPDPEVEGLEEAAMSTIQARETAKAFVMVFNQLFTLGGNQLCTIDEDSISRAIMNGELPEAVRKVVEDANERTRAAIPFSNEQQKELVRAVTIILKESNFSAISPSAMAWFSIATVVVVQVTMLASIRNQNKENIKELIMAYSGSSRFTEQDSSVPEVKPNPTPESTQKKPNPSNSNQKTA